VWSAYSKLYNKNKQSFSSLEAETNQLKELLNTEDKEKEEE
jgi:hypothetical protein